MADWSSYNKLRTDQYRLRSKKKHDVEIGTYPYQSAEKATKATSNFQDTNLVGNYNSEESKTGPSGPRSKVPISEIKKKVHQKHHSNKTTIKMQIIALPSESVLAQ